MDGTWGMKKEYFELSMKLILAEAYGLDAEDPT